MPLDVAIAPKTLTSTLHYLKRGAEKPAYYRVDPPAGVPRWNGEDDLREVKIEDARGREAEFTLDRNGFQIVKAPTTVADFYDPEEIKRVYYPEVELLLKDKLGASRVFVFDHNVRNASKPGLAPPSRQVHNDHTVNSAPRRVRDHLPNEADEGVARGPGGPPHKFKFALAFLPIISRTADQGSTERRARLRRPRRRDNGRGCRRRGALRTVGESRRGRAQGVSIRSR